MSNMMYPQNQNMVSYPMNGMVNYPNNTVMGTWNNTMPTATVQKGITSVAVISNGEAGANDYPVAAGNTAVLIDFNANKFWLKTTDVYGRPLPLEDYNFVRNAQQITDYPNQNDFVKKEEFDTLVSMFTKLCQELGVDKNVQSK